MGQNSGYLDGSPSPSSHHRRSHHHSSPPPSPRSLPLNLGSETKVDLSRSPLTKITNGQFCILRNQKLNFKKLKLFLKVCNYIYFVLSIQVRVVKGPSLGYVKGSAGGSLSSESHTSESEQYFYI